MKTNLAIISSVSEPRYRIILIGNETVSAKRREYKWLRYGSRVRGGDHLNLSLTELEKKATDGKRAESLEHVRFVASRRRPCTVAHSLAGALATRARHHDPSLRNESML